MPFRKELPHTKSGKEPPSFERARRVFPAVVRPDGFQDRASGGPGGLLRCAPETIPRTASFPRKCGWLPAALPSLYRSRQITPARDSSAGAPCSRLTGRRPREPRKRHEKTPLTPLTPCEAILFADSVSDRLSRTRNKVEVDRRFLCAHGGKGVFRKFLIHTVAAGLRQHDG